MNLWHDESMDAAAKPVKDKAIVQPKKQNRKHRRALCAIRRKAAKAAGAKS